MSDYSIFIRGHKANLCTLRREDSALLHRWHNDTSITKYSLNKFIYPSSITDAEQFIATCVSQKIVTFGVCVGKTLVGYAGISNINRINSSGEYFLFIGNKKYWHKGIGSDITKLLIRYAFDTLQLHRIELSVSSVNTFAIALYKKCGFLQEGIKKDACFRDGKYHDKLLFALLNKN